jgi:hypothetical protein
LILINTNYSTAVYICKSQGKDILDDLIGLLVAVAENNVIIQKFISGLTNNAFESVTTAT